MNPVAATRAIALALILCLLALDGAHHVHLPDAGTAQTDCSLCASGGAAIHSLAVLSLEDENAAALKNLAAFCISPSAIKAEPILIRAVV